MKKSILLATMLFAGVISTFAAYTSRVFITMDGVDLRLREDSTYTAGQAGATMAFSNTNGAYAYVAGTTYEQYGTNNLEGLAIGYNAATATETITFTKVIGTLYLVDNVAKACTPITEDGTYTFTATAGTAVNDRFYITKTPVAFQTEPLCYRNGELTAYNATAADLTLKIYEADADVTTATPKKEVTIAADALETIDITSLEAGKRYQVVYNGETVIFRK